jgi:hypothetical protein
LSFDQGVFFPAMCRAAGADPDAVNQWLKNGSSPGVEAKPSGRRGVPREFNFGDLLRIALRNEMIKGGFSDRIAKQIGAECMPWFDLILNGEIKRPPLMLVLGSRGRSQEAQWCLAEGVEEVGNKALRPSIGEALGRIALDHPTTIHMVDLYEIMWRVYDRACAEGLEFVHAHEHWPLIENAKAEEPA